MEVQIYLIIVGRSALAALLGFMIGWERMATGSPVRSRIIALTALTAAATTAMSIEMYQSEAARILAGLVTGIGFLGAGVITRSAAGDVRGLTTAASLWSVSSIGIAVGAGHALLGLMLTAVVYVVVAWDEWPLVTRLRKRLAEKKRREVESQQPAEKTGQW